MGPWSKARTGGAADGHWLTNERGGTEFERDCDNSSHTPGCWCKPGLGDRVEMSGGRGIGYRSAEAQYGGEREL